MIKHGSFSTSISLFVFAPHGLKITFSQWCFFMYRGAPQAPPKLQKPCRGQNADPRNFFPFFEKRKFFGIFKGENTLFSKKWKKFLGQQLFASSTALSTTTREMLAATREMSAATREMSAATRAFWPRHDFCSLGGAWGAPRGGPPPIHEKTSLAKSDF